MKASLLKTPATVEPKAIIQKDGGEARTCCGGFPAQPRSNWKTGGERVALRTLREFVNTRPSRQRLECGGFGTAFEPEPTPRRGDPPPSLDGVSGEVERWKLNVGS